MTRVSVFLYTRFPLFLLLPRFSLILMSLQLRPDWLSLPRFLVSLDDSIYAVPATFSAMPAAFSTIAAHDWIAWFPCCRKLSDWTRFDCSCRSSFRSSWKGCRGILAFPHNHSHSPQTRRSHDVMWRIKPSFTAYILALAVFWTWRTFPCVWKPAY